MSSWIYYIEQWGPSLLRALPKIVSVCQGLYSLWCQISSTKEDNEKVLQAMKLLKTYEDDIDQLIRDPEKERQLMEGLVILMSKIQEKNGSQFKKESISGEEVKSELLKSPAGLPGDEQIQCTLPCSEENDPNKSDVLDSISRLKMEEKLPALSEMSYEEQMEYAIALSLKQSLPSGEKDNKELTDPAMFSCQETPSNTKKEFCCSDSQKDEEEEKSLQLAKFLQHKEVMRAERFLSRFFLNTSLPVPDFHNTKDWSDSGESTDNDNTGNYSGYKSYQNAHVNDCCAQETPQNKCSNSLQHEEESVQLARFHQRREVMRAENLMSQFTKNESTPFLGSQNTEEWTLSGELGDSHRTDITSYSPHHDDSSHPYSLQDEDNSPYSLQDEDNSPPYSLQDEDNSPPYSLQDEDNSPPHSLQDEDNSHHHSLQNKGCYSGNMNNQSLYVDDCYAYKGKSTFTDDRTEQKETLMRLQDRERQCQKWKYCQHRHPNPTIKQENSNEEDSVLLTNELKKRNINKEKLKKRQKEWEDLELAIALSKSLEDYQTDYN